MFFIKEYVPANQIWPNAKNYKDRGYISGYVRGYNIEVELTNGSTEWLSCEWINSAPEHEFDNEFHRWRNSEHDWKPTGRICFRGYGIEEYDYEERETFVRMVED